MHTTRMDTTWRVEICWENIPATFYVQNTRIYGCSALTINSELMRWIQFECQDLIVPIMDMLYLVPVTVVVCARRYNQLGAMVGLSEMLRYRQP